MADAGAGAERVGREVREAKSGPQRLPSLGGSDDAAGVALVARREVVPGLVQRPLATQTSWAGRPKPPARSHGRSQRSAGAQRTAMRSPSSRPR
jgi:hypothetical protein